MSTRGVIPALIVIDMQNDFVSGSLAVQEGATIINKINTLIGIPSFKGRFASKDYHPSNHISFAETHGKDVFSKTFIYHPDDKEKKDRIEQVLWPVHCVRYTSGAEFVLGLNTTSFDAVIKKGVAPGIESYSTFQDVWGRDSTDLDARLKEKGITDLYFVGLATDYCVKWSAIDAQKLGYRVWVVKDAVKSIKPEREALEDLETKGIRLTTTEEVKRLYA